jgi:sensor histidine kinase YesM
MRSTQPSTFKLSPMWRIYSCVWLCYAAFIGLVSQLESASHGKLDWLLAAKSAWSVITPGFMLVLVWPLTGWLERKAPRRVAVAAIHAVAALAFGVSANLVLWLIVGVPIRPLVHWTWPFLYSLMIYSVVAIAFYVVRVNRAAQQQALAFQQAQSLLVSAELDALRSKLNPHFLFNTLHSIIALTRKNPAAAEAALFRFSDMLRYVLDTEKNGSEHVTVADELDFVRDYLDLEALRLGDRLRVEWDVAADAGSHTLPPLTLQPLVENSIKHAFNPRRQPGHLAIRVTACDAQLVMAVQDDGPGADPAQVKASRGLGIRTVARRLQLGYGERAGFDIDTAPGAGFKVTMSVPIEVAEVAT